MPGRILYAQCPCGFERKLSPGSKIAAADFVDYKIAYNADESDLLSENKRDHQVAGSSYRSKPDVRMRTSRGRTRRKGRIFARNVKQPV
jgi:hypothetical protein